MGFRGVVESEGGGFGTLIYEDIVRTQREAGALGLKAGVDLNITYEPAYMARKNTGARAGTKTVQLYMRETPGPVATPVKQLRGFERVDLKPGETKSVTLTLAPEDLQLLDRDMHWRVVPGDFEIMVGKSSEDLPLQGRSERRAVTVSA
jgi:hypothetical protein